MGAVRMRVQTADKKHHNNSQLIHTTPVHQLTNLSLRPFNFFNGCFWLKYESIIYNIASSGEKVVLSESGEKYAQIKHYLQAKTAQNRSIQIYQRLIIIENIFFFLTGRSIIIDYGFLFWLEAMV